MSTIRSLILATVSIGGLLGSEAKAQYGYPDFGPGIAIGEPYGHPGYGGYGYGRPGSYYYSQTTVTTIVYCNRCGHYHDRHAPCGGYGGGYRGGYGRPYRRGFGYPGPYPW